MTSTKIDSSLAPVLSQDVINKIEALLGHELIIADKCYSIKEWLGNSKLPVSLYAGFQAAAIASRMADSLFFLEHLNKYLGFLKIYAECANKIVPLTELELQEDINLAEKNNRINQAYAEQALYDACYILEIVWKECITEKSSFQINIPISFISGGASGFESTAKESKDLEKEIASDLIAINTTKEKKLRAKQLKSQSEHLQTSQQASPQDLMIITVNKANQFFRRVLLDLVGVEGIKQVVQKKEVFLQTIKKWEEDQEVTPPPLWSQEQRALVARMQKTGAILCQWFENHKELLASSFEEQSIESPDATTVGSSNRILPLLSPRYTKENSIIPKQDEASSSNRVLPLLSPRYAGEKFTQPTHHEALTRAPSSTTPSLTRSISHSLFSLFTTKKTGSTSKQKSISLPDHFIKLEDAKKLEAVTAPPTGREIQIYNQTIECLGDLKSEDKRLKNLQKDIVNTLSLSSVQKAESSNTFAFK